MDHLDLAEDSIMEPSISVDNTSTKRDQATTPLSHNFTEDSKAGLVSQLEQVVLSLNRKGMELLQRERNTEAL